MSKPVFSLSAYVKAQEKFFRIVTQQLQSRSSPHSLSAAAEWLPDNFYLVQQTCRQIREDMPANFYRQLPPCPPALQAKYPRIYTLAQRLIVMQQARLDPVHITRFVQLYQNFVPLTMGELWALPVMLRLGLVELLAQSLSQITGLPHETLWPLLTLSPALTEDETVANCITSLRMLAAQDWLDFFDSVSQVEEILRGDPAHIYALMDQETRDRYRKAVEKLSRATGLDELAIARQAIALAQNEAQTERARTAHVGYYLIDAGRMVLDARIGYRAPLKSRLRRAALNHPTPVYLSSIGVCTVLEVLGAILYLQNAGANFAQTWGGGVLAFIPALTVAVSLINWIITLLIPPRVLPKMDFEAHIPAEYKTLVVIPSMLSSEAEVKSLLKQIELHFLRNQDVHLYFALLTDLPDRARQPEEGIDPLVNQVTAGIHALNKKYERETSPPFYLFHRDPLWNSHEGRWMGWERKRGKLHQLNRFLRGGAKTAFSVREGNPAVLSQIKYVITLDADTLMPHKAAHRLVATLAHPLNQAEFNPQSGAVIAGYTLLQPGIEITSTSVNRSHFSRIFAGDAGLDLYSRAVSNAYQDLFGEGSYIGKGIYEIDAFERSLSGRMPENAILSHDLIEGIHGRVGLVTDVVFYEDYPPHYFVYLRRARRWVRGDWQLLPWLFPRVPTFNQGTIPNDLSLISRWKIFDNLRRSLLAPALLAFLVGGWLWLPGVPGLWTLGGALTLLIPVLTGLALGLARVAGGSSLREVSRAFQTGLVRWGLALTFIPYETWSTLGGIATTLIRLLITRKHLLQWTSYADTLRLSTHGVTLKHILAALFLTGGLGGAIWGSNPAALWAASPLLSLWLFSPLISWWISRSIDDQPDSLSAGEVARLRTLARRTWSFFEQFVGPEDHWLPPDHFQEAPRGVISHTTSPTNLGLLFLSTLAAYDLGYIGLSNLATRLKSAFESLNRLEKYRGHFLNWYDTRTLGALAPRYVSTVDSGNLAASFRTLAQGCQTLRHQSIWRWKNWEGLLDTLCLFDKVVGDLPVEATAAIQSSLEKMRQQIRTAQKTPESWFGLLNQLSGESWIELNRTLMSFVMANSNELEVEQLNQLNLAADRTQNHLYGMQREIEQLAPWLTFLHHPPALMERADGPPELYKHWQALNAAFPPAPLLEEIETVCLTGQAILRQLHRLSEGDAEAGEWCHDSLQKLIEARISAACLLVDFQNLEQNALRHVQEMDFHFLFDEQRLLFHIGYNVTVEKLDNNYYDLLASESRIASLVTIAGNAIPPSHWLHLGRPLAQVEGLRTLLSWGGTMFEYLMPALLMRNYEGTLLQRSCLAAINGQINYGQQKAIPWGISESGYYAFDRDQNYQYRTFGVPGLGFKQNRNEDLVVTPYASLLALSLHPHKVIENIIRLDKLQMLGLHGFYEAIDFSAARLPLGAPHAIVRSYMAHHQGMILLSLVNYLHDNIMVRRFHADPQVRSVEFFLQEKVPYEAALETAQAGDLHVTQAEPVRQHISAGLWNVAVQSPAPQVHFLSNGHYSVMITNAGAGFSRWEEIDLTRWRADSTREECGVWIYLQDLDNGELWSAAEQPIGTLSGTPTVQFYPHQVEFRRNGHELGVTMEIVVAPEDDVEIRRISLTNQSERVRHITLTSYGEIILAPQAADARHPAFNNLFVESEYLTETNTLLFRRRLRSAGELPIYLAHSATVSPGQSITGSYETDRKQFLGRGQSLRTPAALNAGRKLSATVGNTLDPIMALAQTIELQPYASAQVSFITLAARSRDRALALVQRYQSAQTIERTFGQARLYAELELTRLELTVADLAQIEELLSALIYPQAALRAAAATLAANRKGQAGLWPFSISGDYPLLLVQMNTTEDLILVQKALQAHTYWRNRGIKIDLVILNQQGTTYGQELRGQLQRVMIRQNCEEWFNRRGGIFVLYADQLNEADRILLETAARVVLTGTLGTLTQQLQGLHKFTTQLPGFVPISAPAELESTPGVLRPPDLLFDNGLGGFSADGREYLIYLEPEQWTPAPWINVIANSDFGFTVSETGAGYTWFGNSSENRLTPWSNDPIADPPGEALYLRDEETAEVWSPTPLPCRAAAPYLIRHGSGYSIFEHQSHGLTQCLRLFAAADAPVKVMQLRLSNMWEHTRRITVTLYIEWVLGITRDTAQQYIVSEYDPEHQALLAHNCYNAEFGDRVAFVVASQALHGLTADRTEFLGRRGTLCRPVALERIGLAGVVKPGLDPCAALQVHIDLPPGVAQEIFFLIGEGANRDEALQLIERYQKTEELAKAWDQVHTNWEKFLETVQVQTPDPAMNLLLNRWLLYQTLSCRVWARSAFYQSSGAFGFRDQLQDIMALLHAAPRLAREHILEAARFQFDAGDVLHWWHPPSGRGVRTRFSDDLLWLPFVVSHYVTVTGDEAILDETVLFRKGLPLETDELERYDHYAPTTESYTLYEHCRRALEKGITAGEHGLPLIGCGDWNDGMNRVGSSGRGESIWLGWFLCATLIRFARLCEYKNERAQATAYQQRAAILGRALETYGWDGAWYRRAYYDDGTPLGSAENHDCQIDSIAQSWAILSGVCDPDRAVRAMESVAERLIQPRDQLLLLLTPPFDQTLRDPGYIKGYPPGIRENGAQYTHAAVWTLWAFAELGQGDQVEALFRLLNPIYHSDTSAKAIRYGVEPYVTAADVYSALTHNGQGGWTWYTGSSGWMYRAGLEAILGIRRIGQALQIVPCIPKTWTHYQVMYKIESTTFLIRIENPEGVNAGVRQLELDGIVLRGNEIPLLNDGQLHQVRVVLGGV